jgi:hypothetical protein
MLSTYRHLVVLTVSAGLLAAAGGPLEPFEGKWRLDKKKTQAVGAPEDLEFQIKPDGEGIRIVSKYREPKNAIYPLMWVGLMTYELPLSADGSEKTNQIGPFAHVSKTTIDGNRMITEWRAAVENGGVEGQWIRTVSPDGKEMTLQVISKASDGRNMDQTLIFQRK